MKRKVIGVVEKVVKDLTNENLGDVSEEKGRYVTNDLEKNVAEKHVTMDEAKDVTTETLRSAVKASWMRRAGFRSPFAAWGGSGVDGRSRRSGSSRAGPAGGCRRRPR